MKEVQRLVRLGWPLEDALTFCFDKRKEGGLGAFVAALEDEARENTQCDRVCRQTAREALG